MGCNDIIAILQAVWHLAITIIKMFLQLYVKVFDIEMLNYFCKNKKLHKIKLYSNDNKITKIIFTIGVFLISTNKQPKMTLIKMSKVLFLVVGDFINGQLKGVYN